MVNTGLYPGRLALNVNLAEPWIRQDFRRRRSLRGIILQNPSNQRLHFAGFLLIKIRACLIEQLFHGRLLHHKRFLPRSNSPKLTIKELPLGRKVQRRGLPMLEELVGEGAEPVSKGEKMVVIFKVGPWYTEEWLSSDELEHKAAETPDIKSVVDSSGKN